MSKARTISYADLSTRQVREIEAIAGPADKWRDADKAVLFPAILHVVTGEPLDSWDDMPFRELVELVKLQDAEGNANSAPASPSSPDS